MGRLGPEKLKLLPVAAAADMVTLAAPVLLTDTATVLLFAITTLPKFTLLGFAVSDPGARPSPSRAMLRGELEASETIARLPIATPVAVGANLTLSVTFWLGLSVIGNVRPLIEKPDPVTLAWVMVTFD